MPTTYEPIATQTVESATASVTFSAIPQTYTDLVIVIVTNSPGAAIEMRVGNNSVDTGTNYSRTFIYGYGTGSPASARGVNLDRWYLPGANTSGLFGIADCSLNNYSNTNTFKTLIYKGAEVAATSSAGVFLWRSTSAINIITFTGYLGNIAAGSTLTIYGIKAA